MELPSQVREGSGDPVDQVDRAPYTVLLAFRGWHCKHGSDEARAGYEVHCACCYGWCTWNLWPHHCCDHLNGSDISSRAWGYVSMQEFVVRNLQATCACHSYLCVTSTP
jgi:hypothetical protein